jgi:hypothetical protein
VQLTDAARANSGHRSQSFKHSTSRCHRLNTSRGNKPKNKQDDEDNDKDVKEDAGDIGTRSRNASEAKNGRDY